MKYVWIVMLGIVVFAILALAVLDVAATTIALVQRKKQYGRNFDFFDWWYDLEKFTKYTLVGMIICVFFISVFLWLKDLPPSLSGTPR